jgi:hypothetical protein
MERAREPLIQLGLRWTGRYAKVENFGLPTVPPRKLFRTNLTVVSLPMEERAARKAGEGGAAGASRNARSEGCDSSEAANGIWNLVGDMTSYRYTVQ